VLLVYHFFFLHLLRVSVTGITVRIYTLVMSKRVRTSLA
jgi:hypothetical protein